MGLYTHPTGYHTPAVMIEPTLSTEELFLILYCIVDDLYPEVAPDSVRFRRSADQMGLSDSEVITLSIMQEGRSNDSELSFHRVVEKDYLHLFPGLISRSRYHRRRKNLMGIQREMLRSLMNRFRLLAMWLSMDSAPITTAESPRWKSAQMSIWAAEAGFLLRSGNFSSGFGSICLCQVLEQSVTSCSAQRTSESVAPKGICLTSKRPGSRSSQPFIQRRAPSWPTTGTAGTGSRGFLEKTGERSGMPFDVARKPPLEKRLRSGPGTAAFGLE